MRDIEADALDLVEADAAKMYAEINTREGLPETWEAAPDWCKILFRTVARDPYGFARSGLRLRR